MSPKEKIQKRLKDLDGIRTYSLRINEPGIRREIEYQIRQAERELKRIKDETK